MTGRAPLIVLLLTLLHLAAPPASAAPPNIIVILADDVGYGDLGCYGAQFVKTPNLDRLAAEGVRLTDAHSTAAVCTPTRYALLTGQYAWRNPKGDRILSGVAPLSISPGTDTVASLLRGGGYRTALVGKWHLGLGSEEKPVDYNAEISPGPLDLGFDEAFFIPATGDRVPCVYVENRRVAGLDAADPIEVSYREKVGDEPTGKERPDLLKIMYGPGHDQTIVNGISRIGYMAGGQAARWVDEDMPELLTRRACEFIERNREQPFFLYYAPHDIHEPMVPNARFKGSSQCGSRGDVIQQLDWSVGEVLATLDRLGLDNTLVMFSSDNGGAIKDTYDDGTNALHGKQPPNGALRGQKGELFEGGHRVPFVARWKNHIAPGTTSDDLIGLVDLAATCAAAAGIPLPETAAPDSLNVLATLLPAEHAPPREHLVVQSYNRDSLALRHGDWVLIPGKKDKGLLYDLSRDLRQEENLFTQRSDKAAEMRNMLERIRSGERTRP